MKKILHCLKLLFNFLFFECPIKTLWANFRYLPLRQAIKLPIRISCKSSFYGLIGGGKIVIDTPNIKTFMIHIGQSHYVSTSIPHTNWKIYGTVIFKGKTIFRQGTYMLVGPGATLTFEYSDTWINIGTNSKIICYEKISIGSDTRLAWDCQIYDTNFHYVKNAKGEAKKLTTPILIGKNCWIANRTTIAPGAVLPDFSIVASNSLINKDFTEYGDSCLYAGSPAKFKVKGVQRVISLHEEDELNTKYGYNFVRL